MKVAELTGAELDYWVAKAEGKDVWISPYRGNCYTDQDSGKYSPSTDWSQGGPIIQREGIELRKDLRHINIARIGGFEPDLNMPGDTPLIAAMRCFVASKFGEEVPDE